MPRDNPLLATLTDFEYDMVGCLSAGFTIADALRILGHDRDKEVVLRTDPRFHAVLQASAAHLATVVGSLSQDTSANVVSKKRQPQIGNHVLPIAAAQTQAYHAASLSQAPSRKRPSDASLLRCVETR
jgi:hypothetical protein